MIALKIKISEKEKQMLQLAGIEFKQGQELDEASVFAMLDSVYEKEVFYAQDQNGRSREKAKAWAQLADKIQSQIPE